MLVLLIAKILEVLKDTVQGNHPSDVLDTFLKRLAVGTVLQRSEKMRFFGSNTMQYEDITISTDRDDKLLNITEYPLFQTRHRQCDKDINCIEKSTFASINSSLGGNKTAPFLFCVSLPTIYNDMFPVCLLLT